MARTDFKTIDEYHNTFPEEIRERMEVIRKIIHKAVPDVEEAISYQIPCFKYMGYLIYYAAFPNHISLSNPWSKELLKKFEKGLKKYKMSKAIIQFPNNEDLPVDLIRDIVAFRKEENLQRSKSKK